MSSLDMYLAEEIGGVEERIKEKGRGRRYISPSYPGKLLGTLS